MRVNKNQPVIANQLNFPTHGYNQGIPLRLEIAARIAASLIQRSDTIGRDFCAHKALEAADALIEAHNNTCEEEGN